MLQFSVRVERDLFEGLQAMAEGQQATFSDVVRFALRNFVSRGGAVRGISNVYITTGPTRGPMSVEVPGQRAELAASRRIVSPDERVRRLVTGSDLSDDAVTAARV
jgi:hypothetical protein